MSTMDRNQTDPPRQTANIFVLFNAFETLCFPTCITDTSRVAYIFLSINDAGKSCKYIHFTVKTGQAYARRQAAARMR